MVRRTSNYSTLEKLIKNRAEGKKLCVGLDPELHLLPPSIGKTKGYGGIVGHFCEQVVEETQAFASAYKLNQAFFLKGNGMRLAKDVIKIIKSRASDAVVIWDSKYADVPHTLEKYLETTFEYLDADAVTLNPYFSTWTYQTFTDQQKYAKKMAFFVIRSSDSLSLRHNA